MLSAKQLEILMRPLNPGRVQRRSQGGANLSYLATWDVRAMLIRVFGFGGFSIETINTQILDIERLDNGQVKVAAMCTVRLTIPQLECVYTESAVAGQTGRSVGDVADFAVKTAESDAMKRACVNLGTQFGLSLYNDGSTNEVVQVILAEGQEWGGDANKPLDPGKAAELGESIGLVPPTGGEPSE